MSVLSPRRAFVMVEVAAVVAILALLGVMLLVIGGDARRRGMLASSEENLHRLAAVTDSYAADNSGLYWGFSWKAGDAFSQWPDLNNAATDNEAHANQAADIIRRRADPAFAKVPNWIPDLFYSHLVLADYLDEALPMPWIASAADQSLLDWQANMGAAPNTRLPYSSSYELPTAFYDKSEVGNRIEQANHHGAFFIYGGVQLGARTTADVTHPSQKVHVYDRYQRHFGSRVGYFGYEEVRLAMLFADGSVDVRRTGDGNQGWRPNSPWSGLPTIYEYMPLAWEPPVLKGPSSYVYGYLRWTQGGIGGRDFGGPQVEVP